MQRYIFVKHIYVYICICINLYTYINTVYSTYTYAYVYMLTSTPLYAQLRAADKLLCLVFVTPPPLRPYACDSYLLS